MSTGERPPGSKILKMSILGHGTEITESVSEPSGGDLADDVTTIGRLVLNGSVTGKYHEGILNLDPPIFDVDWFAFAAEANTDYQFTANQGIPSSTC